MTPQFLALKCYCVKILGIFPLPSRTGIGKHPPTIKFHNNAAAPAGITGEPGMPAMGQHSCDDQLSDHKLGLCCNVLDQTFPRIWPQGVGIGPWTSSNAPICRNTHQFFDTLRDFFLCKDTRLHTERFYASKPSSVIAMTQIGNGINTFDSMAKLINVFPRSYTTVILVYRDHLRLPARIKHRFIVLDCHGTKPLHTAEIMNSIHSRFLQSTVVLSWIKLRETGSIFNHYSLAMRFM